MIELRPKCEEQLPINRAAPPLGVRVVGVLSCLAIALYGIGTIVGIGAILLGRREIAFQMCAVAVGFGFFLWHWRNLNTYRRAAWITQLLLCIIGLLAFPLGTTINIIVIVLWLQPETKAWFGLPANKNTLTTRR